MGRSILFLCILCSACVSNEEYPNDWPPIVVGNTECPDISGTYEDAGRYASTNEYSFASGSRLTDYVYRNSAGAFPILVYVVIAQSDTDEMRTTIHSEHKVYDTRTLSRELGHFVCEDGKIWITQTEWGAHVLAVGRVKDRIGLTKAEDGSLIGEMQSSGAGVALFVVPFKLSSEDYVRWSRFEPIWRDLMQRVIMQGVIEKKVNPK